MGHVRIDTTCPALQDVETALRIEVCDDFLGARRAVEHMIVRKIYKQIMREEKSQTSPSEEQLG